MRGYKSWDPLVALESLYTDGIPRLASDEGSVFTICEGSVKQISLLTAETMKVFKQEEEEITTFALTAADCVVSASRNNLFRYWVDPVQCWRSDCAVVCLEVDPKGSLLAAGGGDNSVRVYQLGHQYLTHCFKDHKAPILALAFHPSQYKIVSCSYDYCIKMFDLLRYKCIGNVHMGEHPVRLLFPMESILIGVTGGQELFKLDYESFAVLGKSKLKKEATALSGEGEKVYIGDESGGLTRFQITKSGFKALDRVNCCACAIAAVLPLSKTDKILVATGEQVLLQLGSADFLIEHQILGHIDEILDLKFIPGKRVLAVASNSNDCKIIDFQEPRYKVSDLKGHTDSVLSVDFQGDLIITGSKDNSVRLWKEGICIAVYVGHAHSVSTVTFYRHSHILSGSLDQSIKMWPITTASEPVTSALHTCIAHAKAVNVVKASPDGKIIASGGHDKLIKLWNKKLQQTHVLEGHKRGVWDLAINPIDKTLASASGDTTLKIWNLADFTCVKTLEGHTNSVIRVKFLPNGTQIVSSSADALVKIFNVRSGACTATLEDHDDKVWGVDTTEINGTCYIATGAADSKLILWKDSTLEEELKTTEEERVKIAQEQDMNNKIKAGRKREAAVLALNLNRPMALFNLVSDLDQSEVIYVIDQVLESPEEGVPAFLRILVDWNTQKKFCAQAQRMLVELLERIPCAKFPSSEARQLQVLELYSEKHFQRVTRLLQATYRIDHFLEEMGVRKGKRPGEELENGLKKSRKTE